MKIIIRRTQKSSRWAAILLASAVAIITSAVVANATQTITTPNAANIPYSLAAGGNSAAITPATNKPVLIMGATSTNSFTGVGHVSLVHISGQLMDWVGLQFSNGSVVLGAGGAAGVHIVYIDNSNQVDIQMASADTILVHNGSSGARAGNVTLIW